MPRALPSGDGRPAPVAIPKFVTDFTWSLKPWPVTAWWNGQGFDIPALPAVDWITAVFDEGRADWLGVFPGLCGDSVREEVEQLILRGNLDDFDDLVSVARDALAAAAGRDWWVATALIGSVNGAWNVIGGEYVIRGVDAGTLSLSAWLDASLHLMLRAMDPKDHAMFLSQLELPPVEVRDEMPEPEIAADAFLALAR